MCDFLAALEPLCETHQQRGRETETGTLTEADRETERQRDRETKTERQRDRETERQARRDRGTGQRDKMTERQRECSATRIKGPITLGYIIAGLFFSLQD